MSSTQKQIRRLRANAAQLLQLAKELEAAQANLEQGDDELMFGKLKISSALERELLVDRAELEYGNRRLRRNFFNAELFGEPAWDILLDLYAARIKGQMISVTSACIAGEVPPTTALRWLKQLEICGYIERIDNPHDLRSSWVRITDQAQKAMDQYFTNASSQSDRAKRLFEEKIILAYERVR